MTKEENYVREAVGAHTSESTVVAACRVVGERDELRRMLETSGVHDGAVRGLLMASDRKTTLSAVRELRDEVLQAEASRDHLLDGIAGAVGHQRGPFSPDTAIHRVRALGRVNEAALSLRGVVDGGAVKAIEEVVRLAYERCADFAAMRKDRDRFERECGRTREECESLRKARDEARVIASTLETDAEHGSEYAGPMAKALRKAVGTAADDEEVPF